jgi:hypothetical protein
MIGIGRVGIVVGLQLLQGSFTTVISVMLC